MFVVRLGREVRGAQQMKLVRHLSTAQSHLQTLHRNRLLVKSQRHLGVNLRTASSSVDTANNVVRALFPDEPVPPVPFHEYLWSKIDRWPDATAVICGVTGQKLSYKVTRQLCRNFGASLRRDLDLKPDDRLGVLLPNIPHYIPTVIGAMEAGVIPTLMNPIYTPDEVAHQLKDSGAVAAITLPQLLPNLQKAAQLAGLDKLKIIVINAGEEGTLPPGVIDVKDMLANNDSSSLQSVKRSPEDIALLPYSSGTTGRPKGVMLTNRNITANLQALDKTRDHVDRTENWKEVIPMILPMFHIYGFAIAGLTLFSGGELITIPKFDESLILNSLKQATILYVAPPLVLYLGNSPKVTQDTLKTLKGVVSGAAPVAATDIQRVQKKMPQAHYKQGYGLTETSPLICSMPYGENNHSSVGPPALNTYVKVIDVETGKALGPDQPGEIVAKGPQVMKGYWKNQKATDEILRDGWIHTGDIGHYDSKGHVYVTDRLKELIKVKGFQVAPAELEAVLRTHPDVADAGVVGAPDPAKGEKPVAFVVLKTNARQDPEPLRRFLEEKLAKFKRVDDFVFVESIPKSAAGKILRKQLKQMVAKGV